MSGDSPGGRWLERRRALWQATEARVGRLERGRSAAPEDVLETVRAYPEIARDLALARRAGSSGALKPYLESVYLAVHRSIHQPPGVPLARLARLFCDDAPRAVRELAAPLFWVTALFAATTAAGAWLVARYPELASLFASEAMIDAVERGELWTDNLLGVFPPAMLAAQIFTNNIVVCLVALCFGVLYGLGTAYLIGLNGFMLGGVFAMTAQRGMAGRLFEFVSAHGFVELSVICLAGAAGVSLGEAIVRPGQTTRAAAFQAATLRACKLMLVALTFLIGAGILEGYVSPSPAYPFGLKLTIGLAYWALFVWVLSGGLGRLRRARHAETSP